MCRTALHLCIIAALLAHFPAPAAAENPIPRGYFVLRSARADQPVPTAILNDPNVAGVSLRRSWASVNPEPERFDFAYLDAQIDAATRHHNKVMLHVDANGAAHVRYSRTYQGLRVYGGDFTVHTASSGAFAGVSVGLEAPLALSTTPAVSIATATALSRAAFAGSVAAVGSPEHRQNLTQASTFVSV